MTKENLTVERWKTQFKETAQRLAVELLGEAKNSKHIRRSNGLYQKNKSTGIWRYYKSRR